MSRTTVRRTRSKKQNGDMEHLTDLQLAETVDYVALRRVQNAYADVVTRRAWPELVDLFLPDAIITGAWVPILMIGAIGGGVIGWAILSLGTG